ncbi:tetratricopeptide repeat protein [Bacteroides sp. UBA939]|uniref:tetratricopeptide repeat protein n=1 Tax=Bacteroides sp. UBA939 TaxID=1946092 RepID=UPI0025C0E669|nr:hypothetical protein [Bacteroides sp. UBA939]
MRNNIITILFWVVFLLMACGKHQSSDRQLILADSLMQSQPDSALHILQNISMQQLTTQADSAYYALLLTQARDKNYVVQTNDSLIRLAIAYYNKTNDTRMQAKAHYYWGCVYRDMNRKPEALKEFFIAASLIKDTKQKRQLGLIYNNMGYIYHFQGIYEKADSIYQLMETIAEELKDSTLWAESLSKQGSIALTKRDSCFSTAEQKLLDAFAIADKIGYKRIKADISADLSRLYSRTHRGEKALFYAKQNLSLRKDTAYAYRAFLLLGDAYYKTGQYDSATFYLNKTLLSKEYGKMANAYMRLADIAMDRGDAALSMKLERFSSIYKDSLYQIHRSEVNNKIFEAEANARITLQQLHYKKRINLYRYAFVSVAVIILISAFFIYRRSKEYRKNNDLLQKDKLQLEDANRSLNQHYADLKSDIAQKDIEIENIKKVIESRQIDNEQKERLQKELDEIILKRNALAKETFWYSPLYAKMTAIIKDYQDRDESELEITEQEWHELIIGVDTAWDNALSRLQAKYQLSKEELHLICLSLIGFPFSHFGYLMHLSRKTLYRKKTALYSRINMDQKGNFRDILRKI